MFQNQFRIFGLTLVIFLSSPFADAIKIKQDIQNSPAPTVGIEGTKIYVTESVKINTVPFNEKAMVILRIAKQKQEDSKTIYDLRYMGMVPGNYDVRNYLLREDGGSTTTLPELIVNILPLLPETHDGLLNADELSAFGVSGGYKIFASFFIIFWIVVLIFMIFYGREKAEEIVEELPPPPTLAELLRPLVQKAASGDLDTAGKAELERLMLKHWRKKLNLEELTAGDALHKMRDNSETGPFLKEVEKWLHRKPGTATADVDKVLEPFQKIEIESE